MTCKLSHVALVVSVLFPVCSLRGQEFREDDPVPLSETERIYHTLSRFSFGRTPGSVDEIRKRGLETWFEEQLRGKLQERGGLLDRLSRLGSLELTNRDILLKYRKPTPENPKERRRIQRLRVIPRQELRDAVLLRSVLGSNQVREVGSDFFRNHFNVDVGKGNVRYFATEYEREVIRANALGSFGDMLRASARHPAMLLYLDNALSRRPPSKQELREIERKTRRATGSRERAAERVEIAKQRGLNENYARELMELHTLGVDNYYTQRDVIEVARILTGWTVQQDTKAPVTFRFRADMHDNGDKHVLGARIKKNHKEPVKEGESLLNLLAAHPGTARFLATRMCVFFLSDDPPAGIVNRVTREFRSTKGDLPSVYRAIFNDKEFFEPKYFQCKFKRPFEFVVSALRATNAEITSTAALHRTLEVLSEPIYECEDPTGYYDRADAWNDPGVMAGRWRFSMDLVLGRVKGVKVPVSFYEGLHKALPRVWKDQLAWRVLSTRMTKKTANAIDRLIQDAIAAGRTRVEDLAPLILGVLLGSPEFQRQ